MHPQKARAIVNMRLTKTQELEHELRERPSDIDLNLELAETYFAESRGYEAVRVLEKALAVTDRHPRIEAKWEEAVMRQARQKALMAERRMETDPSNGAEEELAKARRERDKLEQEIFTRRCDREPENLANQYELGLRFMRRGQAAAALARFEAAAADPSVAAPASLAGGDCLAEQDEVPQALSKYRRAAAAAQLPEQQAIRREALYKAGRLAEEIRLAFQARRYYRELLAEAPDYEDAAARLAALPEY